jgi:hypothetical protein
MVQDDSFSLPVQTHPRYGEKTILVVTSRVGTAGFYILEGKSTRDEIFPY